MTIPELCRHTGISYRMGHYAVRQGLIDADGTGGTGNPFIIDSAETERVTRAAAISRIYGFQVADVLRWQLEGRVIEDHSERLTLAPLAA